jgi:hypothetical protein
MTILASFSDELTKLSADLTHLTSGSSNIRGFRYDAKAKQMFVTFKGGSTYRYEGVPAGAYRAMKRNKSTGRAVNKHLKAGGFEYEKVAVSEEWVRKMMHAGLLGKSEKEFDRVGIRMFNKARVSHRAASGIGSNPLPGGGFSDIPLLKDTPKSRATNARLARLYDAADEVVGKHQISDVRPSLEYSLQKGYGSPKKPEPKKAVVKDVPKKSSAPKSKPSTSRKLPRGKLVAGGLGLLGTAALAKYLHSRGQEKTAAKSYKCKFCADRATKGVIWAEGRAIVPTCDKHLAKGKAAISEKPTAIRDLTKTSSAADAQRAFYASTKISPYYAKKQRDKRKAAEAKRMAKKASAVKKQVTYGGLPMKLEHEAGDKRSGVNGATGKSWERTMGDAYGYVPGTNGQGADGEAIDVYFNPRAPEEPPAHVYKIRQKRKTGEYDEDKFMVGYESAADARKAFLRNMPSWAFGSLTRVPTEKFKSQVGHTKEALSEKFIMRAARNAARKGGRVRGSEALRRMVDRGVFRDVGGIARDKVPWKQRHNVRDAQRLIGKERAIGVGLDQGLNYAGYIGEKATPYILGALGITGAGFLINAVRQQPRELKLNTPNIGDTL